MNQSDFINIVDTAYNIDGPDETWLRAVLKALRPALDQGCGVIGFYQRLSELPAVPPIVVLDAPAAVIERFSTQAAELDGSVMRKAMCSAPVASLRATIGGEVVDTVSSAADSGGVVDSLGLYCLDVDGHGVGFAAHATRVVNLPRRELLRWQRIVAHLTAAFRLRRLNGTAEAVVAPSGTIAHAEGSARSLRARELLRAAAINFDRARSRGHDADQALDLHRALIAGRWTMVDSFDRDGKRYLIARHNTPAPAPAPALSVRETQVVVFTAMAHPLKMIAYELGLTESCVATYLRRALVKLRLPNRLALARHFSFLNDNRSDDSSDPPGRCPDK